MNFLEALKMMREGEKVRRKTEDHSGAYMTLDLWGLWLNSNGRRQEAELGVSDYEATDWHVVKLTAQEELREEIACRVSAEVRRQLADIKARVKELMAEEIAQRLKAVRP